MDYDIEDVELMVGEIDKFPPLHSIGMDETQIVDPDSLLWQIDPKTLRDKCKRKTDQNIKVDIHPECVSDYVKGYM